MNGRMHIGGLAAGVLLITLAPSHLVRIDVRGVSKKALVIQSDKSSPAFAALEDAREQFDSSSSSERFLSEMNQGVSVIVGLHSGRAFTEDVQQDKAAPTIQLSKLVIRADDLQTQNEISVAPVQLEIPTTRGPAMALNFGPAIKADNGNLLPLEERKKRILDYYAAAPLDIPRATLQQRAQPLIDQALNEQQQGPLAASPAPLPSPVIRLVKEQQAPVQPVTEDVSLLRPLTLSGQLQMTEGLAFVGKLHIFRSFNGEKFEDGQINIQEGRFTIWVKEARGYIEAELIDEQGQPLGRAEFDLTQLPAPRANQSKVTGLSLKLKPVSEAPTITVVSSYSFDSHKVEIPGASVHVDNYDNTLAQNEDGDFVEPEFHPQSVFVARAEAKNYWGSLAVGLGNSPLEIQLFPNKMVDAMLNQSVKDDPVSASRQAIIWGKVVDWRGHPLSGATVELAGDSKAKLIYFNNHFLPDTTFRQTSSTGWFAFVNVTPGIHSIRAMHGNRFIPAQTLPAEKGFVSYAQLQFGEIKTAQVHIHDAFEADSNLGSVVHVLGADVDIEIGGHGAIKYSSGRGPMVLEVDSGEDFELARFQVPRNVHGVDFPMIRRSWFAEIAGRKRINVDPSAGTLAGFIKEAEFEVEIRRDGQSVDGQVVYFDNTGHITEGTFGAAGGGFLIYNVSPGPVDLVIRLAGQSRFVFQTHYVESDVVSVVSLPRGRAASR